MVSTYLSEIYSNGFAMMIDLNTTYYYFTSYSNNTIYMFDDNWNYINSKAFSKPLSILIVNNVFYITSVTSIYKTDKNLTVYKNYVLSYCCNWYTAIYYDKSSNLIYAGGFQNSRIDILDLNLNLTGFFNLTKNYTVSTIQGYNSYLYVGIAYYADNGGKILVLLNKTIIQSFYGCFNSFVAGLDVHSILFDEYGFMATLCSDGEAFLFNQNLSYTSFSKYFGSYSMSLDSKNRLVALSYQLSYNSVIDVYY